MKERVAVLVRCQGEIFELRPERYWHLAHPTAGFLLNNAYLAEGLIYSMSAINRMPGPRKRGFAICAKSHG